MDPLTPQAAALAVGCVIATYTDVRWGKIYNWTTGVMVALGLVMNTSLGHWQVGVFGLLASFAVHYPLWVLGVQKGGDVKLMIGIGTLLGPWFMVEATLWYGLLYIPVGLGFLLISGKIGNLFATWRHKAKPTSTEDDAPTPTMMRTAPVIVSAAFAAFATPWLQFLFVTK